MVSKLETLFLNCVYLFFIRYKLKLTPGNTKRGKASKTCLNLFLKDKTATTREKNLMKSVNLQDIARNIPNGVKLSAPSLSKVLNK